MASHDRSATAGGPNPADVEMARTLLSRMGLSPDDLVHTPVARPPAPTFGEYVPQVAAAVAQGTRRCYGSYWNRVLAVWGDRPITDPSASEIAQLAEQVKAQVVVRRNARGGRGAAEHLIAALRCLYRHAIADGWITEGDKPLEPLHLRELR